MEPWRFILFMSFWVGICGLSWTLARVVVRFPFMRRNLPLFCIALIVAMIYLTIPSYMGGLQPARDGGMGGGARVLAYCLKAYALDNDGAYPDGKSSTEVFQKLIDGGYITDPGVFYLRLPGKTRCEPGQRLRPENNCWDITVMSGENVSEQVPLVFPTGYKASYSPGGSANPLVSPYPQYVDRPAPSWWNRLHGWPAPNIVMGITVGYSDARFTPLYLVQHADGSWSIPGFVPQSFNAKGKSYRQLTPDGELPP